MVDYNHADHTSDDSGGLTPGRLGNDFSDGILLEMEAK